jgi:hypothetical protein
MGAFYGSVHLRSEDAAAVRAVVEELARAGSTRFLIATPTNGWIAAYPSESGQDFSVSSAIAARAVRGGGPDRRILFEPRDAEG